MQKQYTTCFSDPVFDKTTRVFKYKIIINDAEGNEIAEFDKSVEDLVNLFDMLISKRNFYLFNDILNVYLDDDLDYSECLTFKPILQDALEEILSRRDFHIDELSVEYLKNVPRSNNQLFPVVLINKTQLSEVLNMGDLVYSPEDQVFFSCLENSSALARAGRVWSLIDPEVNGALRVFNWSKSSSSLMPHFSKVMKKEYESRCQSCLYNSNNKTIFVGFHDAKVMNLENNDKGIRPIVKSVGDEPILGMQFANKNTGDVIIFTENNIKIIDSRINTIGGGSLRKRLEGAYLTTFAIDSVNNLIFLGSSSGTIFVYSYTKSGDNYTLKFLKDKKVKLDCPIECIQVISNYLICGCGLDINIYDYTFFKGEVNFKGCSQFILGHQEKKNLSGDTFVTQVQLLKNQKALVATYSNGLMLFWSIDSATITGAIRAHEDSIIKLVVDEKAELLITSGFNTQIKVWKYGLREVPDVHLN